MKKIVLLFLVSLLISGVEAKVKVACIGNSITYGAGVANPKKNSYPMQLQYMLGDGYEVKNFGISARTLQNSGDYPYMKEQIFEDALAYNADIVVIKLGTNDVKAYNKKNLETDFYNDYKILIDRFQQSNPNVRLLLATPVRCYLPDSIFSTKALEAVVIPTIERLAYEYGCEKVNMYSIFGSEWNGVLMPDKLHPSSIGAGMLAQKIYDVIVNDGAAVDFREGEAFNFHGYKGHNFKLNGVDCKFVEPKRAAESRPWVIRARFWGHEPQLDIDLLERGFAITYCDVADLFGSPKAVERWNEFYKYMTTMGMSKKVVLEGMSRGGLIVYNWAAQNASKVACIYADAPVMDFMSWPVACNWEADIAKMLKVYGFKDLEAAKKWRGQPIDHAKKLVGIPIIHVVGDVDDVVPVKDNTAIFEERFKLVGGNIEVIHKPNVGHHPHSLADPKRLTDFVLKACAIKANLCVKPMPGNEFRSAAGWVEGADWHVVADEMNQMLVRPYELLLIGNSITQAMGGERMKVTSKHGKAPFDSVFGAGNWFPAGISGDRTQNVLWRLQNGNYEKSTPKNVLITIGINNLNSSDTPSDVAQGIEAIANEARKRFSGSNIYVLGCLPAGLKADDRLRVKCDQLHTILNKIKFEGVKYVNPTSWFVNVDRSLKTELYSGDYLHLSVGGYKVWSGKIKEMLN